MRRLILKTSKVLDREPFTISFSTKALQATLLRLLNEWETVQASRDRDAIFHYLSVVFELVTVWAKEGKAVKRAYRALHLRGRKSIRDPEPFAAVILCTSDPDKVDARTRSKWSRALRFAEANKHLDEPLRDFLKRKGGINACAGRSTRRLGRGSVHRPAGAVRGAANQDEPLQREDRDAEATDAASRLTLRQRD